MAEPLKATFFAFRKRERGGVITRASVAFLIIAVVLMAAFVGVFRDSLVPALEWFGQLMKAAIAEDEQTIADLGFPPSLLSLTLGLLVWTLFFYILSAAYEAACLKWMIHGETGGFYGLTLGAETWRVWCVYWVWFLLNLALSLVMDVAALAISGMFIVGTGQASTRDAIEPVLELIQLLIMIYFSVRLAPAAATAIARRRFAFFQAWDVTKGRFWALFGSFALLYVIYFVAAIVLCIVWFAAVLGSAPPLDAAALADPKQAVSELFRAMVEALSRPQTWITIGALQIVGMLMAMVFYVATFGVNARAAQAALAEGKIKSEAA
jgi:hypothetical protein